MGDHLVIPHSFCHRSVGVAGLGVLVGAAVGVDVGAAVGVDVGATVGVGVGVGLYNCCSSSRDAYSPGSSFSPGMYPIACW